MSSIDDKASGQARGDVTAPLPLAEQRTANDKTSGRRAGSGSHFSPSPGNAKRSDKSKQPRRKRTGLIALCVAIGLAIAVYAAGVAIFSNVFYPNTTIAGADVSLIGAGSAATRIRSAVNHYSLTIEGAGFSWEYAPEDADSFFDADAAVQQALAQNDAFRWPVHLLQALTDPEHAQDASQQIDLDATPDFSCFSDSFDGAAFEESLGAAIDAFNEGRSGTFDTASAYDVEACAFSVEKARANEKLDRDKIIAYAKLSLAGLKETASLDALGDDAFVSLVEGKGDSDLQAACDAANALLGANITLKLNGSDAGTIDSAQVAQWIVFDENLVPSIDQEAVSAWASELAAGFDTVGTKRTYTREDGKQITVSGGTFGWKVDGDALVQAIVDAVNNRQTGEITVPTSQAGDVYNGQGARDWGAYVDIDLTEQHARYYDANGNLLWESGVITGNPNNGTATPTGIYMLNRKATNITLRGPKDPETGEYKWESDVQYWMPFVGNSIGLHDASWQASSSFSNPSAYLSVGSHGCVNLPPASAAELYGMLEPGVCVIVHN